VLLDIRGNGMRLDHTAVILKQGRPAPGITIARQKYAGPEVIQLLLKLAPNVPAGDYTVVLVDASGATSNAVPLKIER